MKFASGFGQSVGATGVRKVRYLPSAPTKFRCTGDRYMRAFRTEERMKRGASLAVVGAVALGCMTIAANAAPLIPKSASQTDWNIVQVWGGCGWGFHPNPWG